MKSLYFFGISLAIGLVIIYMQWQQNKKMEEMKKMLDNLAPPPPLDHNFILEENRKLHAKIENAYDKVHQQYQQILIAVDNIPILDDNGSLDEEESMPSYHVEQLIQLDNRELDLSNENLEMLAKESVHGVDTRSINSKVNSIKTESTENVSNQHAPDSNNQNVENAQQLPDENLVSTQSNITANGTQYPKIADLKTLCREKGLLVSGNKNELVQRLLDNGHIFEN
jgi:hypothetical protein